jgi:TPR repeat protein
MPAPSLLRSLINITAAATCGALAACGSDERDAASIDTGRFDARLGMMYLTGNQVPRDPQKAFYLFSTASAAGDADAEDALGRLYADGTVVTRDDTMATLLFRRAVDGKNREALNDLGQMLESGRGGPADPGEALQYYERGMKAGDPVAKANFKRLKALLEAPPPPPPAAVPANGSPAMPGPKPPATDLPPPTPLTPAPHA